MIRATSILTAFLIGVATLAHATAAQAAPGTTDEAGGRYWTRIPSEQGFLSLASIDASGVDDRHALKVTYGAWMEGTYRAGAHFLRSSALYYWAAHREDDRQHVWTAGMASDLTWVTAGPIRIFPRLALGASYRTADPDEGAGVLFGVGLGVATWIGRHCQLALSLDRHFEVPAADTSEAGIEIRWAGEKIRFPLQ